MNGHSRYLRSKLNVREAAQLREPSEPSSGGSVKLVDLFPYDKNQETNENAAEEDRDGSDDEQILNFSDNETHS